MAAGPDIYVLDDSVLIDAILDEDGASADVLRHLQSSPGERGLLPEVVAKRFLATMSGGMVITPASTLLSPPTITVRAHVVVGWIAAHSQLFDNAVPRPTNRRTTDASLRPSLQEVVATAVEHGARHVISRLPSGSREVDGVAIISPMEFYDLIDPV